MRWKDCLVCAGFSVTLKSGQHVLVVQRKVPETDQREL